ncbi:MAG: SemiSWEET family sugar transporter [Alphaproteobacteria bacterium]
MNPEWIGLLAAILTTAAYVPQTIKVLREKHTKSLSLGMYLMITAGIGLWFIYGMMLGSPSLMLANGITFLMALTILIMKIRHG